MKEIRADIDIDAPPQRVWQVLTDFEAYPSWNPLLRSLEGKLQIGDQIVVSVQQPGRKTSVIRPTVLTVEPNRELRWTGGLFLPGLFDGEHALVIEPRGEGGARFMHYELYRGLLVTPLLSMMSGKIRGGFQAMNQALKERAEQADS